MWWYLRKLLVVIALASAISCDSSSGCDAVLVYPNIDIVVESSVTGAAQACLDDKCQELDSTGATTFGGSEDAAKAVEDLGDEAGIRVISAEGDVIASDTVKLPQVYPDGSECGPYAPWGTVTVEDDRSITVSEDRFELE